MQQKLKLHHKLLPLIIISICSFLFIVNGWTAFSLLTNREGSWGEKYLYYQNLTKIEFIIYEVLFSLFELNLIFFLTFYLIKKNSDKLTMLYWCFIILIELLLICETHLETIRIEKCL